MVYNFCMDDRERRRFFRLNDELKYSFFVQGPRERLSDETIKERLLIKDPEHYLKLMRQFDSIDTNLYDAKALLSRDHPLILEYLQGLERKIMLLAKTSLASNIKQKPRPVNLSLRGVAFFHDTFIPKDSRLHFRLDLPTSEEPLILAGLVVYCYKPLDVEKLEGDDLDATLIENATKFRLAVKFVNVTEEKEQCLNRHLLSLQAKE